MKKVVRNSKDERFTDIDQYFRIMMKQHDDFFNDKLSGTTNLKTVINSMDLTIQEKNHIFRLHNTGSETEVYASELFKYCQYLQMSGKVPSGFADQVYVLSVDWPLDLLIDYIDPAGDNKDDE